MDDPTITRKNGQMSNQHTPANRKRTGDCTTPKRRESNKSGEESKAKNVDYLEASRRATADQEFRQHTQEIKAGLSDEEVAEYREAFSLFDEDGDGTITTNELRIIMKSLGMNPNEQELIDMVAEVDVDGNGEIDFDEFLQMMVKKMKDNDNDEDIQEAFRIFDRKNNQQISASDLKHVMFILGERLTEAELEEMLRLAGTNAENGISYEQFKNLLASL